VKLDLINPKIHLRHFYNKNLKIKMFQEFQNQIAPTVLTQNQHVKFQNTMRGKLDQKEFGPTN
jgi:hypothetical protein